MSPQRSTVRVPETCIVRSEYQKRILSGVRSEYQPPRLVWSEYQKRILGGVRSEYRKRA